MVDETRKIQSVERALRILEMLAQQGGSARLSDLAQEMQLNKSTLHGLLNTLSAMGYTAREGSRYTLGLRLREVAQPLADYDEVLRRRFRPLLEEMQRISGQNVYLAAPCGTREYLYIDVAGDKGYFQGISPRGRREGLTTSAMGKVFLANIDWLARSLKRAGKLDADLQAELAQVRSRGYALDLGESEAGLMAFAVPLHESGRAVAGLSVAGRGAEISEADLHEWAAVCMRLQLAMRE